MKGLRTLRMLLLFITLLSALCLLVVLVSTELGHAVFWGCVMFFMGMSVYMSMWTSIRYPQRLGFIHVLVLMTAVSWLAYAFTRLNAPSGQSIEAILTTFVQNLAGLLVLVLAVELLTRGLARPASRGWVHDLVERAYSIPQLTLVLLLSLYAMLTLYRFAMGLVIAGTGAIMSEVSTVQSILLQLSTPVSGLVSVLAFLFYFGSDPKRKHLGLVVVLVQVMMAFFLGRRGLIELLLLGGLIWIGLRGLNYRRLLLATGTLVVVIMVAGPLFQMVRHTALGANIQVAETESRSAILQDSISSVLDEFSVSEAFDSDYSENIYHRAGFFDWTVDLQERVLQGWSVRGGEIASNSIVEMIPRFLFPGKFEYLGPMRTEQKIQLWFWMPFGDRASTVLGYAIADGGWIGVVIYFAGYGVLLGLLLRFMKNAYFPLSSLWAASMLFHLCFTIESDLGMLIGALRFLIIIALVDMVLKQLLKRPKRRALSMPLHHQGLPSFSLAKR